MKFKGLLVAAALMGLMASVLKAESIIPTPISITPQGSAFLWTYQIDLSGTSKLMNGPSNANDIDGADFFTIYDFGGLVSAGIYDQEADTAVSSDWSFSSANLGKTPSQVLLVPADNPGVPNLTWTYTGVGTDGSATWYVKAISKYSSAVQAAYAGSDTQRIGLNVGDSQNNVGQVLVPVPLPAAAWASFGMLGLLGIARMRKAWR